MKGAEMPRTEAGLRLVDRAVSLTTYDRNGRDYWRHVTSKVEAEARSAALAEIEEAVKGLPGTQDNDATPPRDEPEYVERSALLAAIQALREKR